MLHLYKIKEEKSSRVFFTSDSHFYHDKPWIIQARGFKNVDEHNEALIRNWNTVVTPDDYVVHCGDFLVGARNLGKDPKDAFLNIVNRLHGRIYFLWGNHNSGAKGHFEDLIARTTETGPTPREIYPTHFSTTYGWFEYVGTCMLLKVGMLLPNGYTNVNFFCSHFAHHIWHKSHADFYHVCGHSHGNDKDSQPGVKGPKRLDVGVDNFPAPISAWEVKKLIDQKNEKTVK